MADVLANAVFLAIDNEMTTNSTKMARVSVKTDSTARATKVRVGSMSSHRGGIRVGGSSIDRILLARRLGTYRH